MATTAHAISARTISALAAKATGAKFTAKAAPLLPDAVRVELVGCPSNPLQQVATAADALRAEGYTVRVIADGWKLSVTTA